MTSEEQNQLIESLRQRNKQLEERERELEERNEELLAQKEELTAAIDAYVQKRDQLSIAMEELSKRNHELEQILYRASHDLMSPVSSLNGIIQLLQQDYAGAENAHLYSHLRMRVSQMDHILASLRMLSHAAFDVLKASSVDLSVLIPGLVKELYYLPNYATVEIVVEVKKGLVLRTDEFLLAILLKNLLANAITFRDSARPGTVLISAIGQNQNVQISVEDDGEGISPDVKDKVFEMFYRGSERSSGSGLGLYIARSVAMRLNGDISFESREGKTVFHVLLPV